MQDDQWNYPPKRGNNERPRPGGGYSGPLSGQRPGAARPPNATGGRAPSSPLSQSPGPWRDNGWGQTTQQRRGPSGPLNAGAPGGRAPTSYPLSSGGPTRGGYSAGDSGRRAGTPGGSAGPGRSPGGWETGQTWQGQGNTRTSRSLTPPTGRPAQGARGQTGQWGAQQRGWNAEDDEWDMRPTRAPSGKMAANGRAAQGARNQPQARKGTTVRGDWVIEDTKYRAPGSSWRVRLLLLLLASVIALGAGIYFVPGAKGRLLAFLPGSKNAAVPPGGATSGTLTLQVNAPNATVTLDNKPYTTKAGQTAAFSSVAIPNVASGSHPITIHAANFTDFTGQLQMPTGGDTTMTAWLAPTAAQLATLAAPLSKPAKQPDPGVAGDHYNANGTAAGPITITISYKLGGLNPSPFTGQIVPSADTKTAPFKPAALTLVPVITFKNAAGATLYQFNPKSLPTGQFALQVPLAYDAKGAPQFGAPTVSLPANVTTTFTGPAKNDYALYYALAFILPNTTKALTFKCIGAVDNKNFNPEDGLFIVEGADDQNHAHYFYRWGMLWATNSPAQTLTPKAPVAQAGSNEFNDANTAHANASCGK